MKKSLSVVLFFLLTGLAISQNSNKHFIIPAGVNRIVIMQPTDEIKDGLPVMTLVSDTSAIFKKIQTLADSSYIGQAVELYFLASNFLRNKGEITESDPPYLALTQQDGGFARKGFYLKDEKGLTRMNEARYIDIVEKRFLSDQNKLMSTTQLYPHEMGHLLYGMLNNTKDDETSRSVDMHYFSIKTDYSTAFNEGFSEHIENIARLVETNDRIRIGILNDLELIKEKSEVSIKGFENDFRWPLRMGYYKMTMPLWYQKFEDYKRHEHSINGQVRFKNATMQIKNVEDQLTYRNSGVRQKEGQIRNYLQMLSTEGVISSFFTKLTLSSLSNHYLSPGFYSQFLNDTTKLLSSPKEVFSPAENQFLKYFYVFNEYMTDDQYNQAQLIDFIEGYIAAFPSEEAEIKSIFRQVTELNYTPELPPDLWVLVKNHDHRLLVLDAFNAITIPLYTFDINTAEKEDFMTIEGLKEEEAEGIVAHRENHGCFTEMNQLASVDGLSDESFKMILAKEFGAEEFEELTIPELSFSALLTKPIIALLGKLLIYFIFIFAAIYIIFLRKDTHGFKAITWIGVRYLLLWILLVICGLLAVAITPKPWVILIFIGVLLIGINLLIRRKSKEKMLRSGLSLGLMVLIILVSLI